MFADFFYFHNVTVLYERVFNDGENLGIDWLVQVVTI